MNVPYKYRGAGLLVLLLLLLPWVSWQYALRDTFGAWRDCRRLRNQMQQIVQTGRESAASPISGPALLSDGALVRELLPEASRHQVTLRDYKPLVSSRIEGLEVHTAALTMEGSYAGILRVVYHFERHFPCCKSVSLRFNGVVSPDRRRRHTEATLYIEQIVETDKP